MISYFYIILMTIIDIIMESSMKLYVINNKLKFIILGMIIYSLQPEKINIFKKNIYFS